MIVSVRKMPECLAGIPLLGGLALLLVVLGSREEESSIEIWMWTAGITGLCWLIAKVIRDRADDSD